MSRLLADHISMMFVLECAGGGGGSWPAVCSTLARWEALALSSAR